MAASFFFYDLETSGLDPRDDRIMQFAGQRTDENFQPIGEPYNLLIALAEDTLPSPDALMVTGITPQQTVSEGYTEAEFAKLFIDEICLPDTVIVGFNNIRFDDEFIRALLWRSFYDPFEWSYKNGCSRWDMLDVVRMTRALRPEGINWPVVDGKPVNRLELLASENGLTHTKAHDALSDVEALIAITKLVHDQQSQLFAYLFKMRDKNQIKQLVNLEDANPFVYSSGRYDAAYQKTTVAMPLHGADYGNLWVYDLRHDPSLWVNKTMDELEQIILTPYDKRGSDYQSLPVKKLQYNRSPAVAPLGVLEQAEGWQKLSLEKDQVEKNANIIRKNPQFGTKIAAAMTKRSEFPPSIEAEAKIYEGFIGEKDKLRLEKIRQADSRTLKTISPKFDDDRLTELYPRYKARNFSSSLSSDERASYEEYRANRLQRQARPFLEALKRLSASATELSPDQQFALQELQLWFEAIMPISED